MSPALSAYLAVSSLAGPVAGPLLRRRLARGKEDAGRLGERLGQAGLPRPQGRLVWLHAASVGEANSALPLVAALLSRGLRVLVTTGTVTSARRMAAVLPEGAIHQFAPVDTAAAVRGFLDHWRPDLAVWIESELWPRLVVETARRGVPMALVNARVSARSAGRWRRLPGMARALLGGFRLILAQDRETVERLRGLGAEARFAGNLKALVTVPGCDEAELAAIRVALAGRPVWLAASTHEGEEATILGAHKAVRAKAPLPSAPSQRDPEQNADTGARHRRRPARPQGRAAPDRPPEGASAMPPAERPASMLAWAKSDPPARRALQVGRRPPHPGSGESAGSKDAPEGDRSATGEDAATSRRAATAAPLLILAPRHPERGDAVARLIDEASLSCVRRSASGLSEGLPADADVWLADTLGEMGLWYRLAPVAFVGGSLVPVGGHTPFEPVQLGCAVLHGPHVTNFAPAYAALDEGGGAVTVADAAGLAAALKALLADPARAETMRERAHVIHDGLKPDLDALAAELVGLMEAA